ncbi:alpha/beta fold hydrolase [Actinospica robiniae]|uniref:alpha/beta fold hydrolase n=1 Tax=Actinospica robiniae TaxID=304901 RepID=UPI000424F0FF|nr:alpha/beta hydrolase [Actinospica robiniae]
MLIEELIPVCSDPRVDLFTARSAGPAERALLVVHGGPDWDHSYLREPLTDLAEAHRLVFVDLRGCGRSTTGLPAHEYNADAVVRDLVTLLDALGISETDVLGFSTGGLFAQRLAVTAPQRIRRLIVASSSIPPVPPDAYGDWPEAVAVRRGVSRHRDQNPEPTPELVRADAIAGIPANVWRDEVRAEYRRRLDAVRFTADWCRSTPPGRYPAIRPERSLERLAKVGLPILLLHGRQDMTFPAFLAEQTADQMPEARAVVLDQAGHMAHIDQPEAWRRAVAEFLA